MGIESNPLTLHRMKISSLLLIPAFLASVSACSDTRESRSPATPTTALTTHTTQRASFQIVGADTLSDSARILRVLPEQDGDGVIALFADPARRVSSGLAIIDARMTHPQLLWPDSATNVWWTGPHTLAFTTATGRGIRLVGDVHAATLKIADTTDTGIGSPPRTMEIDSSVSKRARAYTDSVHLQPAGSPRGSALTYSVARVASSPDGSMAAFHSAARDSLGVLTNPAWFILDRSSGTVTLIDQITGPVAELPKEAGEWSGNSSFFYAKGKTIWEAEIQRTTSQPNP